jgi:hypothetical protein
MCIEKFLDTKMMLDLGSTGESGKTFTAFLDL